MLTRFYNISYNLDLTSQKHASHEYHSVPAEYLRNYNIPSLDFVIFLVPFKAHPHYAFRYGKIVFHISIFVSFYVWTRGTLFCKRTICNSGTMMQSLNMPSFCMAALTRRKQQDWWYIGHMTPYEVLFKILINMLKINWCEALYINLAWPRNRYEFKECLTWKHEHPFRHFYVLFPCFTVSWLKTVELTGLFSSLIW